VQLLKTIARIQKKKAGVTRPFHHGFALKVGEADE